MITFPVPPTSRNQLKWHVFEETLQGDWILNLLPPFYAELFEFQEQQLIKKSNTGWIDSKTGKSTYVFFDDLTDNEIDHIHAFIEDYKKYVIIGKNENIEPYFTDELDCCCALDYTYERIESFFFRTEIGALEKQTKYDQFEESYTKLVQFMIQGLDRLCRGCTSDNKCLAYVPATKNKDFHLPMKLVRDIHSTPGHLFSSENSVPVVNAVIKKKVKSSKILSLKNKIKKWDKIISKSRISLDRLIEGCEVYVIDDLYQSGITMWSFAKYLKSAGAASVKGLVCVKTLRDTDNL
ncbi:hypothetical protein ACFL6I_13320 [candidate division KSB1 bacterium]